MAYTEGSTTTRNKVRLLVGDVSTSTSGEWLDNGSYDTLIGLAPNVWIAAQLAANSLSALFAGPSGVGEDFTEKKVGDLVLKRSEARGIAQEFRSLSVKFGRMSAAGISPYSGGISRSDKQTVEQDTDRVVPAFTKRLFDNRSAQDLARPVSST